MKSTGIIRKIDELGRVVIPKEIRGNLDILEKDSVEIFVDGNKVIIQKYNPTCCFCGGNNKLSTYKDKLVCKNCINKIANFIKAKIWKNFK